MRHHLHHFLLLSEDDPYTPVARNLWTVNTQVLTAALWLLFELIFSKESEPLLNPQEIQDLASKSLKFLQNNQHKSTIANRGVRLIESLLEMNCAIESGTREQFSLQEIMSCAKLSDTQRRPTSPRITSSDPCFAPVMDQFADGTTQWEDILSAFCEI